MYYFKKQIVWVLLCCIALSFAACSKPVTPTEGATAANTEATAANTGTTAPNTDLDTKPDWSAQTAIVNTEGMTDLQKAIVITAESYYLRGKYGQYDMTTLVNPKQMDKVERRITGLKAPEDYTRQHTGYNDCSGFVCDVYKFALDMRISSGTPWTKSLTTSSHVILKEKPATSGFADMTAEELSAKEKEFTDTLQPGDIIVYRYNGEDAGHAMLYVGNGMMIHSSGKSYDHTANKENYEETGTFLYEPIADSLLTPGHRRYLFDKSVYVILRPLNSFKKEIPEATQARMGIMRGIMAEKISSHTYGQTVSPNGEISFTFYLANHSNMTKTLTVSDTVPEYTTYVSGAQTVNGNGLSWDVTVPAGGSMEVSYTVKVNADAPVGKTVKSSSTVCGIKVNCPEVQIGNTLTSEQQAALTAAFHELKGSNQGIALVNAIYAQTFGKTVFAEQTISAIWENTVLPLAADCMISPKSAYAPMFAPNLYGGRHVVESDANAPAVKMRTRLVTEELLIVGDVLMTGEKLYLYTTDGLWDLQTKQLAAENRLETLLTEDRFVVLRPSLGF